MRLMKEHPGEPRFFFYVAVSMALQAPPGAKGHILLTLAERWMDKARTENRLKTLEGRRRALYLRMPPGSRF